MELGEAKSRNAGTKVKKNIKEKHYERKRFMRPEFTERETVLFISGVTPDQLPEEMAINIKDLKINENYRLLSRKLSMILGQ